MRARDSLKRDPFVEPSVRRRCLEADRVRRSATSLRRTVASHDNVLPGDVVVDDLWSTGYREPGTDDSNDYTNMGSYYEREMDTGDDEDFVLECGNVYDF